MTTCGIGLAKGKESESLDLRLADGLLRIAAPNLKFVSGKPLERLQNGAPVPFAFQLAVSTDRWATVLSRDIQRFVFSYDLWEEKFAVVKMGYPRKSVSHLGARAAEAWCVNELALAPAGIGERQPFWVRLDVRSEDPAEQAELDRQDSVSLTRLIEMFSRRTRGEQNRWLADAGPFRLDDLKKGPRAAVPERLSLNRGGRR